MQQTSGLFQSDITVQTQDDSHVSHAFAAGDARTDTILDNFTWTGTTGQAANVTYSFENVPGSAGYFDASSTAAAKLALQAWANVANIHYTQQNNSPEMLFSKTTFSDPTEGGVTNTSFVGTTIKHTDVEISATEPTFTTGSFGFSILLHEIGHSLGLKHPGNYGPGDTPPYLSAAEDNFRSTVMSYNPDNLVSYSNPPTTPMIYDIAAAQYLYGANTSYNAGNTFYDFSAGAKNAHAIWDGGGIDTFSAAGYTGAGGVKLDLTAGLEHYNQIGQNYIWVAFGANIENAEGSKNNDTITGNDLGNLLSGHGGADILSGENGNDTIFGGAGIVDPTDGNDQMAGGLGDDQLYGNAGNDTIYGGRGIADAQDGNDLIYAGKGADAVYGNAGNDTIFGGGSGVDPLDGADLIFGGKGADIIYGNGSDDTIYGGGSGFDPEENGDAIYGGAGNDVIYGNGGNDTIYGGEGNDTMNGGAGDDLFYFDANSSGVDVITGFEGAGVSGGDRIFIAAHIHGGNIQSVNDVLVHTTYDGTNAFIDLGGGHGVELINIGAVTLSADDIVII